MKKKLKNKNAAFYIDLIEKPRKFKLRGAKTFVSFSLNRLL